jgi:SAM-dependent methyltransferase
VSKRDDEAADAEVGMTTAERRRRRRRGGGLRVPSDNVPRRASPPVAAAVPEDPSLAMSIAYSFGSDASEPMARIPLEDDAADPSAPAPQSTAIDPVSGPIEQADFDTKTREMTAVDLEALGLADAGAAAGLFLARTSTIPDLVPGPGARAAGDAMGDAAGDPAGDAAGDPAGDAAGDPAGDPAGDGDDAEPGDPGSPARARGATDAGDLHELDEPPERPTELSLRPDTGETPEELEVELSAEAEVDDAAEAELDPAAEAAEERAAAGGDPSAAAVRAEREAAAAAAVRASDPSALLRARERQRTVALSDEDLEEVREAVRASGYDIPTPAARSVSATAPAGGAAPAAIPVAMPRTPSGPIPTAMRPRSHPPTPHPPVAAAAAREPREARSAASEMWDEQTPVPVAAAPATGAAAASSRPIPVAVGDLGTRTQPLSPLDLEPVREPSGAASGARVARAKRESEDGSLPELDLKDLADRAAESSGEYEVDVEEDDDGAPGRGAAAAAPAGAAARPIEPPRRDTARLSAPGPAVAAPDEARRPPPMAPSGATTHPGVPPPPAPPPLGVAAGMTSSPGIMIPHGAAIGAGGPPPPPPPHHAKPPAPPQLAKRDSAPRPATTPTAARPHADTGRRGKPWFADLFDEDYLRTLPFLTPQGTQAEAEFVAEAMGLAPGSQVLDVGCGYGRHAMELAARGFHVVGLDLSTALLLRGGEEAQRRGLQINFVRGDMRELDFDAQFDGAYCLFSTFGYFDDETNKRTVANLARALRPGGRLLLEILNRDYVIADLPTRVWWEGDGCLVLEEVELNYYSSRIQVSRSVVFEDGRQLEHEISVRAYSLHEVGKLLHAAGLRVLEVSGGYHTRGRFFGNQSRHIIVLAERKDGASG